MAVAWGHGRPFFVANEGPRGFQLWAWGLGRLYNASHQPTHHANRNEIFALRHHVYSLRWCNCTQMSQIKDFLRRVRGCGAKSFVVVSMAYKRSAYLPKSNSPLFDSEPSRFKPLWWEKKDILFIWRTQTIIHFAFLDCFGSCAGPRGSIPGSPSI